MYKEISGYNGRYTIDDEGNIYSKNKRMRPFKINSGYLGIKLTNKGESKHYLIHRLVAEYFIGKQEGFVVDHIDGNRLNNKVENLRYCTQKENLNYKGFEHHSGINHYKAVFTIEDIKYIRECREKKGMRNRDIYSLYPNVSHTAIDQVLNYKSYR